MVCLHHVQSRVSYSPSTQTASQIEVGLYERSNSSSSTSAQQDPANEPKSSSRHGQPIKSHAHNSQHVGERGHKRHAQHSRNSSLNDIPLKTTLQNLQQSIDTPRHQPRSVARATLQVRAARTQEAEERGRESELRAQKRMEEVAEKHRVQGELDRFEDCEWRLVSGSGSAIARKQYRKRNRLAGFGNGVGEHSIFTSSDGKKLPQGAIPRRN